MADRFHASKKDRDLIGRTIKTVRGMGKGELPLPRRRRIVDGGGGGSSTNVTTFAIVTDQAAASTYTSTGITGGSVGKAILLDEDMQKTSSSAADKIEFKSLHFVALPVDAIVILHCTETIEAGDTWPDKKVWGEIFAAPYELYQITGAAEFKSLGLPEGANKPEDMRWLGGLCEE